MSAVEIGRICEKIIGREAGKKCVIINLIDKNYVLITGPKQLTGVRRRRTNINHLKLLEEKISINQDASDEEIMEIMKETSQ
jgi:large subunit ribosomal protein L14e